MLFELWGNRIEILAKKNEQERVEVHKSLLPYIQQLLELHEAHKLKSLRENEKEFLEKMQKELPQDSGSTPRGAVGPQETQTQLQETQAQLQETQAQLQETQWRNLVNIKIIFP